MVEGLVQYSHAADRLGCERENGRTDGRTDGWMDGRTDGHARMKRRGMGVQLLIGVHRDAAEILLPYVTRWYAIPR